jgi:hypothetical protein
MELVYHTETERIIIEMKSLPRLLGPSDKPRMIALLLTAASLMAGNTRAGDAAGAALLEGQPAAWLSTDGKSDEWKITTSRCRELLGRLASHDALAEQYLPRVNEKARLLRQSPNLDWKKKTAVEYLENMLEDLLAGRAPHERYAGREFGYPYCRTQCNGSRPYGCTYRPSTIRQRRISFSCTTSAAEVFI